MEIVFEGPSFASQEDENRFFDLLYKLPQYSGVKGKGAFLYLELKLPTEKETVFGLFDIFSEWSIETNVLFKLKSILPESDIWSP